MTFTIASQDRHLTLKYVGHLDSKCSDSRHHCLPENSPHHRDESVFCYHKEMSSNPQYPSRMPGMGDCACNFSIWGQDQMNLKLFILAQTASGLEGEPVARQSGGEKQRETSFTLCAYAQTRVLVCLWLTYTQHTQHTTYMHLTHFIFQMCSIIFIERQE